VRLAAPLAQDLRERPMLLHEGRSVIYVARQLGHPASLTMSTYGHVMEELDDAPRITARGCDRGRASWRACALRVRWLGVTARRGAADR